MMQKFHSILSVGAPHMRTADVEFKASDMESTENLPSFEIVQDGPSLSCPPLGHGLASLRDQ